MATKGISSREAYVTAHGSSITSNNRGWNTPSGPPLPLLSDYFPTNLNFSSASLHSDTSIPSNDSSTALGYKNTVSVSTHPSPLNHPTWISPPRLSLCSRFPPLSHVLTSSPKRASFSSKQILVPYTSNPPTKSPPSNKPAKSSREPDHPNLVPAFTDILTNKPPIPSRSPPNALSERYRSVSTPSSHSFSSLIKDQIFCSIDSFLSDSHNSSLGKSLVDTPNASFTLLASAPNNSSTFDQDKIQFLVNDLINIFYNSVLS